jgi:hypothetical protein
MLRKAKVCALDHLLLERFGGKVGRGRAVELSRGCDSSRCLESPFTPVLTYCNDTVEMVNPQPKRGIMKIQTSVCSRRPCC